MIRNLISLSNTLIQLELALCIELNDAVTEKNVDEAISRLESYYNVRLKGRTVDQVELDNFEVSREAMFKFQNKVLEPAKSLCLIQSLNLFNGRTTVSMASVQYLGTSRDQLKTTFKSLQSKSQYHIGASGMDALIYATDNIQSGDEKRLLVCMFVAHKLGLREIVAIIAQYLYLSIIMEDTNGY